MSGWWHARTPRERVMLLGCLAFVVAVPVWLALTAPPTQRRGKMLSSVAARQGFDRVVRDKAMLEKETDRVKPEVQRMVFSGGADVAIPEAVRTLQECAAKSGLHIRETKPLRVRRVGALYRAPISVRFSSTRFTQEAVPFLYRIEDPAGRLVIEKLNVSSPDPKSSNVDVELQVALFAAGAQSGSSEEQKR